MNNIKGKYLITTDNWFIAPDGFQYKSVWGSVRVMTDDVLGVKTNEKSTNWYLQVGDEDNHVIIAGCQVHYAVKTELRPYVGLTKGWDHSTADGFKEYERPSFIYIAEDK